MGRDAELDPARADRRHVGLVEIALAEMDEIRVRPNRDAPIVVDDELRAGGLANRQRRTRFSRNARLLAILDPQLNQPRADANEPLHPGGGIDDGVEAVEGHKPLSRLRERGWGEGWRAPSSGASRHLLPQAGEGRLRPPHDNAALPTTGVEGSAKSRVGIGPALWAARPASIAWRNAAAIATGSPAVPTAVLSSTAS